MESTTVKQSAVIAGRDASVRFEDEFWRGLREIAQARNRTLSPLIRAIRQRHRGNLPSAVRVFVYSTMITGSWLTDPQ
jgi:predicted DNA-binding ribbon-helix-helix protein